MSTTLPFERVPTEPARERTERAPASALEMVLGSHIELGTITSDRSLQTAIGASEVGYPCPRRLAYALSGAPVVNHGDPMRLLVGTGVHLVLEEIHHRLDRGAGRFRTELATVYRNVPGKADLLDTYLHLLLDWKTCSKERLAKYAKDGAPINHRVQIQIYAAGLRAAGYDIERVGVVFLPYDGALSQIHVWEASPDPTEADAAIDRLEGLRGKDPADVPAVPDRLCAYCAHYNPRSTDLNRACPGTTKGAK